MIVCVHCRHETAPDALNPVDEHPLKCPSCNAVFPHSILRHLPVSKIEQYIDNMGKYPMYISIVSSIIPNQHWCCSIYEFAANACSVLVIVVFIGLAIMQYQKNA